MTLGLESWTLARPEIFLAAVTLLLLVYGVVRGEVATPFVSAATSVVLLVTAALLFAPYQEGTAFASLFLVDRLTATMKALVLIGASVAVLMSRAYFEQAEEFSWKLTDALSNGSPSDVQKIAHKFKGSSATCGFNAVASLAASLEKMGAENKLEHAAEHLEECTQTVNRGRKYLETTLEFTL